MNLAIFLLKSRLQMDMVVLIHSKRALTALILTSSTLAKTERAGKKWAMSQAGGILKKRETRKLDSTMQKFQPKEYRMLSIGSAILLLRHIMLPPAHLSLL